MLPLFYGIGCLLIDDGDRISFIAIFVVNEHVLHRVDHVHVTLEVSVLHVESPRICTELTHEDFDGIGLVDGVNELGSIVNHQVRCDQLDSRRVIDQAGILDEVDELFVHFVMSQCCDNQ